MDLVMDLAVTIMDLAIPIMDLTMVTDVDAKGCPQVMS
jgi:hypothetical protein